MSTPAPDTRTPPTQVRRPWRTTLRTTLTTAVALIPILPQIASAADIDEIPAVAAVLAVAAAVGRVLALESVEKWLDKYAPWLAAEPYEGQHRKDQ